MIASNISNSGCNVDPWARACHPPAAMDTTSEGRVGDAAHSCFAQYESLLSSNGSRKRKRPNDPRGLLISFIDRYQKVERPQFSIYSVFDHASEIEKKFLDEVVTSLNLSPEDIESLWEKLFFEHDNHVSTAGSLDENDSLDKENAWKPTLLKIKEDEKIIFVLASRKDLEKQMGFFRPMFSGQFAEKKYMIELELGKEINLSWPEVCAVIILAHKPDHFKRQFTRSKLSPCSMLLFRTAEYLHLEETLRRILWKGCVNPIIRCFKDTLKKSIESSNKALKKRRGNDGGRIMMQLSDGKVDIDNILTYWIPDRLADLEWFFILRILEVKELMPQAEHKNIARKIFDGFRRALIEKSPFIKKLVHCQNSLYG